MCLYSYAHFFFWEERASVIFLQGYVTPTRLKITIEMYNASDTAILQKIFSTIIEEPAIEFDVHA